MIRTLKEQIKQEMNAREEYLKLTSKFTQVEVGETYTHSHTSTLAHAHTQHTHTDSLAQQFSTWALTPTSGLKKMCNEPGAFIGHRGRPH